MLQYDMDGVPINFTSDRLHLIWILITGRGLGSLVGGFLMGPLGVRNTFRIMALVCGITCIVYFILNRLFFMKAQEERRLKAEQNEKDEKGTIADERNNDKELGNCVENGIKKDKVNVFSEGKKTNEASDSSEQGQVNTAFQKSEWFWSV